VNRWSLNDGVNYMRTEPVVTHFYGLGSVCGYPKFCPVPFKEDDLWNGYPEETNAPYGNYKRMMMVMQQAFRQQWGLKGAHLIPVNMYGEHDHFDLKNSHVIPALLRKFLGAKNSQSEFVEVWGDGTPTREFLYAGDCADAIVKAVYTGLDTNDPINIGTGDDISISDLTNLIKEVIGFEGEVRFTGEVSVNGQPKRRLDVSRAKEILGFEAHTKLRDGLKKTFAWYIKEAQSPKEEQMQNKDDDIAKIANEIIDTKNIIDILQSQPDLEVSFVKEIRAAVRDQDKLKLIAQDIDDCKELRSLSREFLKNLISRLLRLHTQHFDGHVENFSAGYVVDCADGYVSSFAASDSKDVDKKVDYSFRVRSRAFPKHDEEKAQLSPTDWLVRTGYFTKEEAECIVEEGKKAKPDRKRVIKPSPVDCESVMVPELVERPNELPKKPEVKKDLDYYTRVERFKRIKARNAVIKANAGTGRFRREGSVGRTLDDLENQFNIAVNNFHEKYGIPILRNPIEKRGKRTGSGNFIGRYTSQNDISDTEIMAAMLISDKIRLPRKSDIQDMRSAIIACPQEKGEENESQVSTPEPEPELWTPSKVEEKKKTLFGTIKSVIRSVLKKTKLI
jgi:hypothetical protein